MQHSLSALLPKLCGGYDLVRIDVFSLIKGQSANIVALLEKKDETELGWGSIFTQLFFLLVARSSKAFRSHFESDRSSATVIFDLDACYEGPVEKIAAWQAELVEEVLLESTRDDFMERVSDFRTPVLLSMRLAKLAGVECTTAIAVIPSERWTAVRDIEHELSDRIHIVVKRETIAAVRRVDEFDRVLRSGSLAMVEAYLDHHAREHASDLERLERSRWCDEVRAGDRQRGGRAGDPRSATGL